jgi:hypothetical protein
VPLHLLQVKTKLAQQFATFMAGLAAACPADDDCPDLKINFSYDNNKKMFSDLVASGTFYFSDPTGATGMLGTCQASAKIPYSDGLSKPINANPTIVTGKGTGPQTLMEVRAELCWSTASTCVPGTQPALAVPSTNTLYYYGTNCQVLVFEYNSAKAGNTYNHYYVGRTYAVIGYDEKLPPNNRQSSKGQVTTALLALRLQVNALPCLHASVVRHVHASKHSQATACSALYLIAQHHRCCRTSGKHTG